MPEQPEPLDVVAIGSAIVDVLSECDDALLERLGLVKGTMSIVDADRAAQVYEAMGSGVEASGGSAANTVFGVASLGGTAGFIGKVADDDFGRVFTHDIRASGVEFSAVPLGGGEPTARCLILVTPDAERTMSTFLGVAGQVGPTDVDLGLLARARVTYIEGYLVGVADEAVAQAVALAHESGGSVALTLSDPIWVDLHRDGLRALLDDVDIVFANEHEACSLFEVGNDTDRAVDLLRERCETVAVTRGEHGSIVARGDDARRVPAARVDHVVDSTGAGDLYAAGFLFGLARGADIARCAEIGSAAAADVISHMGARPLEPLSKVLAEAGLLDGLVAVP